MFDSSNVNKLFLFMFVVLHFYAACCIDDVSRGSVLGYKIDATLASVYRKLAS
jgi:hypothetical protein